MFNEIHQRQVNAHLAPTLTMRVGIPHKSGRLTHHAFDKEYPVMVSANAFFNPKKREFKFPDYTDLTETDFALDSAGFVATRLWAMKGRQEGMAGVYPWSYAQYLEFASETGCSWYSQPDLCCEPQIASNAEEVDYRVRATATLLEGCLQILNAWQNELAMTCSATVVSNLLKPPVPVLQGWTVSDYLNSLELLHRVWERWEPWLAPPVLIGIGSVCRRDLHHPEHGLYAILAALEGKIPKGSKVHLFGIKGAALTRLKMYDWIASSDSMAWDMQSRIKAHKNNVSNSTAHRCHEMTEWMSAAARRLKPTAGDQFRLAF